MSKAYTRLVEDWLLTNNLKVKTVKKACWKQENALKGIK